MHAYRSQMCQKHLSRLPRQRQTAPEQGTGFALADGDVVTSDHELHKHRNPSVMIGAGLLARNAKARPTNKTWVKTFSPGSRVVADYFREKRPATPLNFLVNSRFAV